MPEPYYKQHWIEIDPERHAAYDQILAFHPAMEPILRPLELRAGMSVLDVGSGPGHTTLELARRVGPSGKVTGVDINAEFVARSSARARDQKANVEFVHSGFPPLPGPRAATVILQERPRVCRFRAGYRGRDGAGRQIRRDRCRRWDSDWDMLALDLVPSRGMTERVLAASKSIAIEEPKIGRRLFGMFRAAGLAKSRPRSLPAPTPRGARCRC